MPKVKTINIKTSLRKYKIIINPGLFLQGKTGLPCKGASILKDFFKDAKKVFLITDDTINSIYCDNINDFLQESGFVFSTLVLKDGEEQKNIQNLGLIYEHLIDFNLHRNDLIIAFGGGVIGDLAGFAASTFHRGVNLLQFPTTLLSQIDSSIGGKTAVNVNNVKNVAGTFYQPHLIMIDPLLLKTLPDKEIINGLAEMIKYGAVFDRYINETLRNIAISCERNDGKLEKIISHERFYELICKCCRIKADVVCRDEFDKDYRGLLNFGHTFGHALEKVSDLSGISHGQAVAFGMLMAADASILSGDAGKSLKEYFLDIYKSVGLPTSLSMDIFIQKESGRNYRLSSSGQLKGQLADKIIKSMGFDKKFTSSANKFIFLKDIARPFFAYDVDENILRKAVNNNLSGE